MSKRTNVSLKDIAKELGVSIALVSYVQNGKEKEKRVGPDKVVRIRKALKDHNYIPNYVARSLKNGSTKTIGLIVTDIANTFFSTLARICEDEAKKSGYTIVFGSSDENAAKSAQLVETLINRQIDGLILVPSEGSNKHLKDLIKNGIPLVLIDRYLPEIPTSYVVLDNFEASFDACTYLINQGKKNIVLFAYKTALIHMKERIRGYKDAMKQAGMEDNIKVIEVNYESLQNDVHSGMSRLYEEGNAVDAFLFATNTITIAGLYSIKNLGIKVPEEAAVIGFDGSVAFDFFYSPLSYISQPMEEIAKEAVRNIIQQINGSRTITKLNLKHQLVLRDSTK